MQKLQLDDYQKIKNYLDEANYEGYNSNFVTMMMWDHEYHVEYEIHDHFLVMLQNYKDTLFFAMPFCKQEYYQEAIDYMMEYASVHDFPFLIDGVTSDVKRRIQEIYGNTFLYEKTPENDDYIYEKEKLETLSGKKMQKRRNHYNAFIKEHPDFQYKEIEAEDIDNVLACLRRWDSDHDNAESVQSEFIGIMYLLMHRDILPIKTGCIYINGVLEAFIIGSKLKHQTIQIHVEKANKEIRGLYVAICKYFLENNYPEDILVNREEDMGIASLRKAKQSLHPVKMIHKYKIQMKDITIEKANNIDTPEIISLWKECFIDEDEASTIFYFNTCYQAENTFVVKQNNKIISALQIVPYDIEKNTLVYFILGVCTNTKFQGNGLMKQLLHTVLNISPYKEHRIFLQAYHPEIYYPFGFHEKYYLQKVKVNVEAYQNIEVNKVHTNHIMTIEDYVTVYQKYCKSFKGYRKRDARYYQQYLIPRCKAFEEQITGLWNEDTLLGYVIYQMTNDIITITEVIYAEKEYLTLIIGYFLSLGKELSIIVDLSVNIIGKKEVICTMMTNDLVNATSDSKLFINELY